MMGCDNFQSVALNRIARNVFEVDLPAEEIKDDFEYYIEVADTAGTIRFPATAGDINRTVVLLD
jgi:hypothetical protein